MNYALLELVNRDYNGVLTYGLPEQEVTPTGLPQLDAIIGGGIPRGRIVEIHGPEDSGKTALALCLARQLPGPMLYVDADHGLSPYILRGMEGYLLDAGTMENTLDACITAAGSGTFSSIVIDSVAALPTNDEIGCGISNWSYVQRERQAKVMSKALPILAPVLHHTGCTLILVNQLREKPGMMYGNPERPTGGKAMGYYASLRLDVRRVQAIKAGESVTGQVIRVQVEKCKYSAPGKSAKVRLIYGEGLTA